MLNDKSYTELDAKISRSVDFTKPVTHKKKSQSQL